MSRAKYGFYPERIIREVLHRHGETCEKDPGDSFYHGCDSKNGYPIHVSIGD